MLRNQLKYLTGEQCKGVNVKIVIKYMSSNLFTKILIKEQNPIKFAGFTVFWNAVLNLII